MDQYLEDEMLSSIKRREHKNKDIMSGGEEGGGGSTQANLGIKQRLSFLTQSIHKETRQAESEVEDNNDESQIKQEQENKSSTQEEKKYFRRKFNFRECPRIEKKYLKQYHLLHGYASDTNEDTMQENRYLRLCQFLLLLDNSTFLMNDRDQEITDETIQNIMSQTIIPLGKKASNTLKLGNVDNNTSMILDFCTITQGDEQSINQTNQLIEDCCQIELNLQNKTSNKRKQAPLFLRSLSLNETRKQIQQNKSKLQRANTYEIDRITDEKNPFKKKFTLKDYINHFISENRKCLQTKKNCKKIFFKQQSWRDLDCGNPSEYRIQFRKVNQVKQQIQSKLHRSRNSGLLHQKGRGTGIHMNDSEFKKFGLVNLSSSLSITDENLSFSENDFHSNSESGTPLNKYNDLGKNYQKSKFHQSKRKSEDQKSEENDSSQAQNILDTALSFEINQMDKNNKLSNQTQKIEKLKKEKHLKVILERIKKAINELVYLYNYYRVTDLIFMEEEQCPSSMYSSIAKRSSRIQQNKIIKFGETIFSQQYIQDPIQQVKGCDSITSPVDKCVTQFLFDDINSSRKKSESQFSNSQREYPITDGWEITSQQNCGMMLISAQGSLQPGQKLISDRFLPLYNLLKSLQTQDLYQKVVVSQIKDIQVLRNLENIIQAAETCNQIREKILILKSQIIAENNDFIELSKYLKIKYNSWKLKRWFVSFKKRKTLKQKAQLLESMQNKKTICRICEKEILMTNMKKHSINCKQQNELNQQLKAQLKEMNSSLFYFFQQNRELQVQYTLIQKNLDKMIISQQMLIESRNKNQIQSPRINSPTSLSKNSPKSGEQESSSSLQQKRRFTCMAGEVKNKLGMLEFDKNQQIMTPIIKFMKQNVDVNKEIMTNSEQLPNSHPSNIDCSSSIEKSDIIRYSVEVISQSDKVKPITIQKRITKNASIIIQETGEENQCENIFSNSLPNFNINGKSNSSITTNQESKSQLGESQNDKAKQLPDILEEESVTSPIPYALKSPVSQGGIHIPLLVDSIINGSNIQKKIENEIESESEQEEAVVNDEDDNQKSDKNTLSKENKIKQTNSEEYQIGQRKSSSIKNNKEYLINFNAEENSKESEDSKEDQQNLTKKMLETKYKISGSKQINGVPMISLYQDSLSFSNIQLTLSNTNANNKKFIFDNQNQDGIVSSQKDFLQATTPTTLGMYFDNQLESMLENIIQQGVDTQQVGTTNYIEQSPQVGQTQISKCLDDSCDIKQVFFQEFQDQLQDSTYINGNNTQLSKVNSENLPHNIQLQIPLSVNNNYLSVLSPKLIKNSQESKSSNKIIGSSDIRDIYHNNCEVLDKQQPNCDTSNHNQKCQNCSLNDQITQSIIESNQVNGNGHVSPILKHSENIHYFYKGYGHHSHSPLQPILEQKIENDVCDCCKQQKAIKVDNETIKQAKDGIVPHEFSQSSLSSSLSEIDLMVADFFKKIQLKNENERHQNHQIQQRESKMNSDTNLMGSQWVFSQEFSPKGNKLNSNALGMQQHYGYQDTLNCIDQQITINSIYQQNKSSIVENSILEEKENQGDQKFSDYLVNETKNQKLEQGKKQCNILDIPTTKTLPHNISFQDVSCQQINNQSKSNIDETNKLTTSNLNQQNSLNVILSKQNQINQIQSPIQEGQILQGQQGQAQPLIVPKKIVLQKLVSIDCQSVNSSTSNLSNPKSNKNVDSQNANLSNGNINSSTYKQNLPQHEQVHEVVPKGTALSIYSNHSRKSIRLNTIDIVSTELNDCFHTNQSSTSNIHQSSNNPKDGSEEEKNLKTSKFKDNSGSSSPKGNYAAASSFSQSRSFVKQDSNTGGNKLQKQKSIFGQKFSKQKSESFNLSDDEMCRSEYIDQVPDLSTQQLMKMKHNQKKQGLQQMDSDIYEEEDSLGCEDKLSNNSTKRSKSNSKDNKSSNKQHNENHHHHRHHHHHHSHNHSKNQSDDNKSEKYNEEENNKSEKLPSNEKLDAKDLSYISKSSQGSSQNSNSDENSSFSSSSSSYGSNSSDSMDEEDDFEDYNEDSMRKRAKTPQTTSRYIEIRQQKKARMKVITNMKKKKSKDENLSLTPSPQKNLMRRQSLPLHLLLDFKNNGGKSSEIQKDIVQLSTNFEIKIKQHEKYQCQTKLRITNLVQNLGKIFIIQDFKSTSQQKMQLLCENQKRIEFLLKKITVCNFKTKVQEIVKLFSERSKLIQQIEQIEKIIQSTLYQDKKKEGDQSDHSMDSEPKSPQCQARGVRQRRFARSGTFNGKQQHPPINRTSIEGALLLQSKKSQQFLLEEEEQQQSDKKYQDNEYLDQTPSPIRKKSQDLFLKNRKLKIPQQQAINDRRNSCLKINFENILSKQLEKEEDLKIEKGEEFLPKNSGYSSDGILDNPYSSCGPKKSDKETEKNSVGIKDFDFLKLISKGAFGRVWLVRKKNTEDVYAMKIVNFAEKMNKNHLDSLKKENDILSKVQGDYVVKAVYTFTHESYICFVMEYLIGGDLGSIIQTYGVLEESVARFYIAEIVLAIHNLHQIGIIHRDLKPDNLLLDSKGHLKLTDFGLSDMGLQRRNKTTNEKKKAKLKIFNSLQKNNKIFQKQVEEVRQNFSDKQKKPIPQEILEMKRNVDSLNILQVNNKVQKPANRIIGTPDYIAPEILRGEGLQNPAIDWWSVGVMLFELLIGIPPFNDDTVEKIFDNIKNLRIAWDEIPVGDGEEEVSQKAINLMKKLLHPDPKLRLGSQSIMQIQQDPFFTGIDWNNLRKMAAPIIPEVKNIFDTSNFDKDKVYLEGEQIDPFFGLPKGIETVNEAKKLLDKTGFSVKRYDVLFEENQKHIEKEEIQMQKMVKELEEQEKEIELLENECGGDESNDEQTFQEYGSIITRNKAFSTASNLTKSCYDKKNSSDFSPLCELIISKMKTQDGTHA